MPTFRWSAAPYDATPAQRRNFVNVQLDGIAVGLSSAASPFLPVLLTRLGASNFEVGLLSSMPGVTGLILSIFIGRFLQTRRNIVPWYSASRLLFISAYAATGLATLVVPQHLLVRTILAIWALATLPQTALAVCFSVVMNAVAGPQHRYELMSRRWSVLGLTNAVAVFSVGQLLDHLTFPVNYQVVFLGLSLAGLISFYFSSHIELPDQHPSAANSALTNPRGSYLRLALSHPDFLSFLLKRFVFMSGTMLSLPLFPLYLVRVVQANDAWIGTINTVQTAILLVGYFGWTRLSRGRGSRLVLLWATGGLSLYPALVALTQRVELIAVFAGLAGIFQAGIDLVFFDELMKTVPDELSATFVSIAHSFNHLVSIIAPLAGTFLADHIGLGNALLVSAGLRLAGFLLFAFWQPRWAKAAPAAQEAS